MYERLGYEVIGELKDYLTRGYAEILLRKTVGPIGEFAAAKRARQADQQTPTLKSPRPAS